MPIDIELIVHDACHDLGFDMVKIITFDQLIEGCTYITDFRNKNLAWYFSSRIGEKYHPKLFGNSHIIQAKDIKAISKSIISDISKILEIELPRNPLEAQHHLDNLKNTNEEINNVINYVNLAAFFYVVGNNEHWIEWKY